jgi:hypothetical protein
LNKSFKKDSVSELATITAHIQFICTVKEIKKIFEQMTSTAYCGEYVSMKTGDTIAYDKFGAELKYLSNAKFKDLDYIDEVIEA